MKKALPNSQDYTSIARLKTYRCTHIIQTVHTKNSILNSCMWMNTELWRGNREWIFSKLPSDVYSELTCNQCLCAQQEKGTMDYRKTYFKHFIHMGFKCQLWQIHTIPMVGFTGGAVASPLIQSNIRSQLFTGSDKRGLYTLYGNCLCRRVIVHKGWFTLHTVRRFFNWLRVNSHYTQPDAFLDCSWNIKILNIM